MESKTTRPSHNIRANSPNETLSFPTQGPLGLKPLLPKHLGQIGGVGLGGAGTSWPGHGRTVPFTPTDAYAYGRHQVFPPFPRLAP